MMKLLHKANFLGKTYQPKYETINSLMFSLLSLILTFLFILNVIYSEIYNRKVSNIAYMGLHKYEKPDINQTIRIDLNFDYRFCDFFYVSSLNDTKTYFNVDDSSIYQNISLLKRNREGYFYSLKVYTKCKIDNIRNYYRDLTYNVTFNYDVVRADYLNVQEPMIKEKISQTYYIDLGDKNEKSTSDFDAPKSVKVNLFKFDYIYYRILDNISFITDDFSQETLIHSLEKISRTESSKPPPTELAENLLVFKLVVDHNDYEVLLIKRQFMKISNISSKILGIFTLLKWIFKILLKIFYFYSDKIYLVNSIFHIQKIETSNSPNHSDLFKKSEKSRKLKLSPILNDDFLSYCKESHHLKLNETLETPKNKKTTIKFNFFNNIKFCLCRKNRYINLQYKLVMHAVNRLQESASLPKLFLSLFLLNNSNKLNHKPKLKIYPYENDFKLEYKKLDTDVVFYKNNKIINKNLTK